MRFLRDVAGSQHCLLPGLAYHPRRLLGIGVLVEVGDKDVGALPGEGEGHGAADAAVASGDESDLAVQSAMTLVRVLPVVGTGRHR